MTLLLNSMPTTDPGMEIKTHGFDGSVWFCHNRIAIEDFLYAVEYVLTNTDLKPHDPRLDFIKAVKDIEVLDGWEDGNERLQMSLDFGGVKPHKHIEIKEVVEDKDEKLYRADKKRRMKSGQT